MRRTLLLPSLLLAACTTTGARIPELGPAAPAATGVPRPVAGPTATTATGNVTGAAQSKVTGAADLVDHLGDSVETAVSVPKDAPNDGLDWMNNWTFDRYGRFRIQKRGIGHAGVGDAERRYRITTIELPDGSTHEIFFDITENWNAWQPSSPPPH
jgi:hypothetical protein